MERFSEAIVNGSLKVGEDQQGEEQRIDEKSETCGIKGEGVHRLLK
jgi:hypothetical protein